MSLFAPTDPRGPDRRRKQLMAKLAQQGHGPTPMPARAGGAMGTGGSFRGANTFRPPATHGNNVMQSVLQRLGIGGRPGMGEYSPGEGAAISYNGGGSRDPFSHTPEAISGGRPIAPYGEDPPPRMPPANTPAPPAYGEAPRDVQTPVLGSMDASSGGQAAPSDGFPQAQRVDLGGGLFYDPVTDKVVDHTGGPVDRTGLFNSASGARGLYRE